MKSIELHLFSNSIKSSPNTSVIEKTFKNFVEVFGEPSKIKVWCDKNPNTQAAPEYIENLTSIFGSVSITKGLADGYVRAVKESSSDYLFMLEHDWSFNKSKITHNLEELTNFMSHEGIMHLRFNKRANVAISWDRGLKSLDTSIPCCTTPSLSNNPHIIDRKMYTEKALKYLNVLRGSKGIELELLHAKDLTGHIYGPAGYPATLTHIDGRNSS